MNLVSPTVEVLDWGFPPQILEEPEPHKQKLQQNKKTKLVCEGINDSVQEIPHFTLIKFSFQNPHAWLSSDKSRGPMFDLPAHRWNQCRVLQCRVPQRNQKTPIIGTAVYIFFSPQAQTWKQILNLRSSWGLISGGGPMDHFKMKRTLNVFWSPFTQFEHSPPWHCLKNKFGSLYVDLIVGGHHWYHKNNIVLTWLFALNWGHSDIAKKKSHSRKMIRLVVNKTPG